MAFEKSEMCVFCGGRSLAKRHLQLPFSREYVSVCEGHYEQLRIALRNELVREVTSL